ncbi:MAG TPA: transcriptional regulator [Burkholderiaceae bacterium]|nr:transcriptional regulator [Burkholderiaceae bacterium]
MTTLTITSRSQDTFRKEVLQHLGVALGSQVEVNLLPNGRAELKAAKSKGSAREPQSFLKGKTNDTKLIIKEINDAIADTNVWPRSTRC